jgi:hypothetical protein
VASFFLTSEWQEFTTVMSLPSGVHIVGVRYEQLAEDVDGDVILDWIVFERQD